MTLVELFLLLSACIGLTIQIVHATIFDKLGIRQYFHKWPFIKELTGCSMCTGWWVGFFGLFCVIVSYFSTFLFLVLTVPFASSFWSFFFERYIIHKDEEILKLEKDRT